MAAPSTYLLRKWGRITMFSICPTHIWRRQPCIQVIMETSDHASGIIKVGCEMSANHQVIINTNKANKSKSGKVSLHEPSHEHLCATSVWTDSCCDPEFQISRLSAGLQSPHLHTGKNCEQSWLVKCAGKKGSKSTNTEIKCDSCNESTSCLQVPPPSCRLKDVGRCLSGAIYASLRRASFASIFQQNAGHLQFKSSRQESSCMTRLSCMMSL